MSNPSIFAAFERMWQHTSSKLSGKADKETVAYIDTFDESVDVDADITILEVADKVDRLQDTVNSLATSGGTANYDLVINVDYDAPYSYVPVDGYSFDNNDAYDTFMKVKNGENVNVLIQGNTLYPSGSTKRPSQTHPINILTYDYGTDMYVIQFPYSDFYSTSKLHYTGGLAELEFYVNETTMTVTLNEVRYDRVNMKSDGVPYDLVININHDDLINKAPASAYSFDATAAYNMLMKVKNNKNVNVLIRPYTFFGSSGTKVRAQIHPTSIYHEYGDYYRLLFVYPLYLAQVNGFACVSFRVDSSTQQATISGVVYDELITNTIYKNRHDLTIEFDPDVTSDPKKAFKFNSYEAKTVLDKLNAGEEVSVLIKGTAYFDSSGTKYPVQAHPINIYRNSDNSFAVYFNDPTSTIGLNIIWIRIEYNTSTNISSVGAVKYFSVEHTVSIV